MTDSTGPWERRMFYMTAFLKCVAYLSVGPALIMLNKYLLENGFKYPVTLSSLGQICIAVVTFVAVKGGLLNVSDEAAEYVFKEGGWKGCVGVGVFKAMTLSFGNTVYLHLPLGYIQMLKAFSPVLMLFLLYITGVEKRPTIQVALSVLSIAAFTAITTTLETSATALGLFYMFMAQATEAGSLVVTQKFLKKKKFTIVESQYFLAPASALGLMCIAAGTGEYKRLYETGEYHVIGKYPMYFFFAASLGLLVNYLTFAVIQATSSTMLKVLGTVRNVVAVVVGGAMFNEHIGSEQWLSYAGTLAGFTSYTYYSMRGAQKEPEKKDPKEPSSTDSMADFHQARIRSQSAR